FWIAYDQSSFVAVSGNVLPPSDGNVHYSIVPAGTYTQAGGADVVVPNGSLGIIANDGTTWSLVDMVELPAAPPVTKQDIQQFAYTKDEYVNQVLVDTVIAPSITVNSVNIT